MTSRQSVISLKNLSFSYKNQMIFENYDFDISGNQVVGLIGVNGSGKSTLLKLILGLLKPNKGSISIFGRDRGAFENKFLVSSSLQEIEFPATEKVGEILRFVGDQYPKIANIEQTMEQFSITDFQNKACGQLSGGMRRRLSLACAFVSLPQVILLDEPTTGLDASSRKMLLQNIKDYQAEHKALILMISHHPHEAMNYVDQFFHLKSGQIQSLSPQQMGQLTKLRKVDFQYEGDLKTLNSLGQIHKQGNRYSVITSNSDDFIKRLSAQDISFSDLKVRDLKVEEMMEEIP